MVITHTHTQTLSHTQIPLTKAFLKRYLDVLNKNSNNWQEDFLSYWTWRHEVVLGGGKKIF